jgi:hypothetical protein
VLLTPPLLQFPNPVCQKRKKTKRRENETKGKNELLPFLASWLIEQFSFASLSKPDPLPEHRVFV